MAKLVINLNPQLESAQRLIGIANGARVKSVASWFGSGSEILNTEQDIRNTKRARIFVPYMVGFQTIQAGLTQALANGGVASNVPQVAEREVELANEIMTKPLLWRPRSGEQLEASEILQKYQTHFINGVAAFKDNAFWANIVNIVQNGPVNKNTPATSLPDRGEVTATTEIRALTAPEERGKAWRYAITSAVTRIMEFKDAIKLAGFDNSSIRIVVTPSVLSDLEADQRYNVRTDSLITRDANISHAEATEVEIGRFAGKWPIAVSTQISDNAIDYIVGLSGAAKSVFMIQNYLNYDKAVGINAYVVSMEAEEGTGVFFPQYISIGSPTLPARQAVSSAPISLTDTLTLSVNSGENPTA